MFSQLKQLAAARFALLSGQGRLLQIDHERDPVWEAYFSAFPAEARQEHNCSACRHYIRTAGTAVLIDSDNRIQTMWDLDPDLVPEEYRESVQALHQYVLGRPVKGLFFHIEKNMGVDRNADPVRNVIWEHFHAVTPIAAYDPYSKGPATNGTLNGSRSTFKRALEELTPDAVATVLDLINQNSLYRGPEHKHAVEKFKAQQGIWRDQKESERDFWLWRVLANGTVKESEAGIRNSAIGTLLVDLSLKPAEGGKDLENAVAAFEHKVSGGNYKRPTAVVTPNMIQNTKGALAELGLMSSLERRRLDSRDLPVTHALFVHRPKGKAAADVFSELAGDVPADPKTLDKVEEIKIEDFLIGVVPTAKAMRVLFERSHFPSLVTLTGPVDPEAPPLFKWENSFGWSYAGGTADSVKERVKKAGGKVDGWMRVSLSWFNTDDLDLHFMGPHGSPYVNFSSKGHGNNVSLDVDMNIGGESREPVENIHVKNQLPAGTYEFWVNQYTKREDKDSGYEFEVEVNGETFSFSKSRSPNGKSNGDKVAFTVDGHGNVKFKDNKLTRSSIGHVKWGLKTGLWHSVRAITLSPNQWERPEGNKQYFFLLEGAASEEETRPFYNEFLRGELDKHRKVMEVLGAKITSSPSEGAELSGLGFSESQRNHLYVEVEGAFKRTVKVLF